MGTNQWGWGGDGDEIHYRVILYCTPLVSVFKTARDLLLSGTPTLSQKRVHVRFYNGQGMVFLFYLC